MSRESHIVDGHATASREPIAIAPCIHLVAGPGLGHAHDANSYVVTGSRGAVLVDCGAPAGAEGLVEALSALGLAPRDLCRLLGTHGHLDHVGGARFLADLGLPLSLHPGDISAVETGDPDLTAAFIYREPFPPTCVGTELIDGEEIDLGGVVVRVVHAPGHTPGSVAVVVLTGARRVLLAGDVLWGGYHPRIGSDLEAWDASLARLEALAIDDLSWGHGPPYLVPDGRRRIAEARAQLGVLFNPWFKPPGAVFRY